MTVNVSVRLASCDDGAGPATPAPTAEVWLTTPDGRAKLAPQPALPVETGGGAAAVRVRVNEGARSQPIEGFGAALTNAAAYVIGTSPQRAEILRALFSPTDGIGISYVRLAMFASDFTAVSAYTYDDVPAGQTDPGLAAFSIALDEVHVVPRLQQTRALNPDLRLMASPWSAPAWMKTPATLNGGRLRPEFHGAYAAYFVRFVEAYRAKGLPIDAVTVQNEPQHATDAYPTMRMEAAEQAAFVGGALGPAFRAAGLAPKILVWDHNWDRPAFPLAVLQDPTARPFVGGVAWHCYAGDASAQTTVLQAFPGVPAYFTECSGGAWDADFGSVVRWNLDRLFIGAVRNGARTVLLWNLALDEDHGPHRGGCGDCRGVVTVRRDGGVTYEPEYYAIGHLSRAVRPGAYRVASTTGEGGLQTVAFVNADGSRVLVVLNTGAAATPFDVEWGRALVRHPALPGGAVVTLRWDGEA